MKKKILRAVAFLAIILALGSCSCSAAESHGKDCGDVCYYTKFVGW